MFDKITCATLGIILGLTASVVTPVWADRRDASLHEALQEIAHYLKALIRHVQTTRLQRNLLTIFKTRAFERPAQLIEMLERRRASMTKETPDFSRWSSLVQDAARSLSRRVQALQNQSEGLRRELEKIVRQRRETLQGHDRSLRRLRMLEERYREFYRLLETLKRVEGLTAEIAGRRANIARERAAIATLPRPPDPAARETLRRRLAEEERRLRERVPEAVRPHWIGRVAACDAGRAVVELKAGESVAPRNTLILYEGNSEQGRIVVTQAFGTHVWGIVQAPVVRIGAYVYRSAAD